jgi:rhamnogalacturonyl hydrolase YesR
MYNGNKTGGVLGKFPDPPYYWWLSGAAWGGMLDYYLYTGDHSYVNVTYDAMVSQISVTNDYLPAAEEVDEVRTRLGAQRSLLRSANQAG